MRKLLFNLLIFLLVSVPPVFAAGEADIWNSNEAIVTTRATGAVAVATSIKPPSGTAFQLYGFYLNLSSAPTTSENFTVTLDSGGGAAYDTNIYTRDLTVGSVTDVVKMFDEPIICTGGDEIDFAWANTDTRTYGLTIIWRRMR